MAQIGTLAAAPAVTIIQGQSKCDQYIVIGESGDALPLDSITVEIDGKPFILIQDEELINAFAKWQMEAQVTGVIGCMLKISTGVINKNTTYRFVNTGATTPPIFAFSEAENGVPMEVASMQINPTSSETFDRFSALFLNDPGNITNMEFIFADGHPDTLTYQEASALFNLRFSSEGNGRMNGVLVIDNTDQSIRSVRVNTAAVAVNALTARIPDAAFAQFMKAIK